mmetsp:Transcript_12024/g.10622  ORF Transcript_12024/g.10622 Transcript_12024/m.10622 type:complete len:80 (+) Transcript_12024:3-242(+)
MKCQKQLFQKLEDNSMHSNLEVELKRHKFSRSSYQRYRIVKQPRGKLIHSEFGSPATSRLTSPIRDIQYTSRMRNLYSH